MIGSLKIGITIKGVGRSYLVVRQLDSPFLADPSSLVGPYLASPCKAMADRFLADPWLAFLPYLAASFLVVAYLLVACLEEEAASYRVASYLEVGTASCLATSYLEVVAASYLQLE